MLTSGTTPSNAGRMEQRHREDIHRDAAEQWLAVDPDPATQAELKVTVASEVYSVPSVFCSTASR